MQKRNMVKEKCKIARKRCNQVEAYRCALLTKFTMPTGKQTKDNYSNKLTDCQKQTKNPHLYLGGEEGNKTKRKENRSKIKALLVSILCLFRDTGCKPMKVNKIF